MLPPRGHEHTSIHGGSRIEIGRWPLPVWGQDIQCKGHEMKCRVGWQLQLLATAGTAYTEADLMIMIREQEAEVWTQRALKAHELGSAPKPTEYKDVFWLARSTVVEGTSSAPSQKKKSVVKVDFVLSRDQKAETCHHSSQWPGLTTMITQT